MSKIKKELIVVPSERIISKILLIRGKKVMLDKDLAELFGVETKRLKEAVRRNIERFPADFMFELTRNEYNFLRTQFETLEKGRGKYSKFNPLVFTEYGVAMLSGVLNSKRAIQVNIQIIKTFIKLKELLSTNTKIRLKIEKMEKKYDRKLQEVFNILKQLLIQEERPKSQLGFRYSK